MRYQAHDIEEVDDDGGVASCVGVVLRDAVQSFWLHHHGLVAVRRREDESVNELVVGSRIFPLGSFAILFGEYLRFDIPRVSIATKTILRGTYKSLVRLGKQHSWPRTTR